MPEINYHSETKYTEEVEDIIGSPPSWILQWSTVIFFLLLIIIVTLSSVIRYPDIIKTKLKINSYNSPKPIVAKTSGKIVKLLVKDKQRVLRNQALSYIENTASHEQMLVLRSKLINTQERILSEGVDLNTKFDMPMKLQLGSIQPIYQAFFQAYLSYESSIKNGFYIRKKYFLYKTLDNVQKQREQLLNQQALQQKDYNLSKLEYEVHEKLFIQKVEPLIEFQREQSKLLSKEYPIEQLKQSLIQNQNTFLVKKQEILEIENQINVEKLKFIQSLSTIISEIEAWKATYILSAYADGVVYYNGVLQENQYIHSDDEVFNIKSNNPIYFGDISIPQYNMGKVSEGQRIIIKLKSYPHEEYGILWGKLENLSSLPMKDGNFTAKAILYPSKKNKSIELKNGMLADVEIITEESSLLFRMYHSIVGIIK